MGDSGDRVMIEGDLKVMGVVECITLGAFRFQASRSPTTFVKSCFLQTSHTLHAHATVNP